MQFRRSILIWFTGLLSSFVCLVELFLYIIMVDKGFLTLSILWRRSYIANPLFQILFQQPASTPQPTSSNICFVQQGIKLTEVWHWWDGFLLVPWFDIVHTNKQHTRADRLTHPYKYILTPPVMCSQQLSVLHWMNNLLILKFYFTDFHSVFAFQKLTCRSHISVG